MIWLIGGVVGELRHEHAAVSTHGGCGVRLPRVCVFVCLGVPPTFLNERGYLRAFAVPGIGSPLRRRTLHGPIHITPWSSVAFSAESVSNVGGGTCLFFWWCVVSKAFFLQQLEVRKTTYFSTASRSRRP